MTGEISFNLHLTTLIKIQNKIIQQITWKMIKTLKTIGLTKKTMPLIKLKKYNLQEFLEIEIKRINCLYPSTHKNKTKEKMLLF
jgi:hypothetical protein